MDVFDTVLSLFGEGGTSILIHLEAFFDDILGYFLPPSPTPKGS